MEPLHEHALPAKLQNHDKANDGYEAEISLELLRFAHSTHVVGVGSSATLLLLKQLVAIVVVKGANTLSVYI